ncbi:MAG: ribbon-helix-helix domain-containing protein [Bacteroidales bacterium]|nr:ribbon-helix-helix domain-containing protein [Bacteroidales bacterium]
MGVVRFSISIEDELLRELDQYVDENKFTNRSQTVRQINFF